MTPESADQETERLILRRWHDDDLEPFAELVSDPEVMRFISDGRPLDRETARSISDRSRAMWDRLGFGPWAAIERDTGTWVGRIGLNELAWWPGPHKIEVGFELRTDAWARGLATEGAAAALRWGFITHDLDRIISVTRSDHRASRRVMEKIGLTYQGVELAGGGVEVAWYAAERFEWLATQRFRVR